MSTIAECPSCSFQYVLSEKPPGGAVQCPRCGFLFALSLDEGSRRRSSRKSSSRSPKGDPTTQSVGGRSLAQDERTLSGGSALPLPLITGLVGSALLMVGVFTPIIHVPIWGNMNYIRGGWGDGIIILILAFLTGILIMAKWYRGLWFTGLCSLALMGFTFTNLQIRISQGKEEIRKEMDKDAAKIGSTMLDLVDLQWGCPVLLLGATLVVAAATINEARRRPNRETAIRVAGAVSVPLMLLLSGMTTWLVHVTPAWIQEQEYQHRVKAEREAQEKARQRAAQEAKAAAERKAAKEAEEKRQAEEAAKREAEREAETERSLRFTTKQTVVLVGGQPPGQPVQPAPEWPDASAHAVQQGDVRVQVVNLRVNGNQLIISLLIENVGNRREVLFLGWNTAAGGNEPRLNNNFDEAYKHVALKPGAPTLAIPPGKQVTEEIGFEYALNQVQFLRLVLPASAFKGHGLLQLQIPKTMIASMTALSVGAKAVPGLVDVLKNGSPKERANAVNLLAEIGPSAAGAVPELVKALKDKDPEIRLAVVTAFGKIGPGAKVALTGLLQTLTDPEEGVRQATLDTLKKIGPFSKTEAPALGTALKDPNTVVRLYAAKALEKLGSQAQSAIPALGEALRDKDRAVRVAAATALGTAGPEAKAVMPAIIQVLKDPEKSVRMAAIGALARIGTKEEALVALIEATGDEDSAVAKLAVDTLEEGGRVGKAEIPALVEALKSEKPSARKFVFSAIGAIGPDAEKAVPALIKALNDKDENTRKRAAWALGKIGPKAWSAAPDLGKALDDKSQEVKRSAAIALGQLGTDGKPGVPKLIPLLKDKELHDDAEGALVKVGKAAVRDLLEALEVEKRFEFRMDLIAILGKLGPDAEGAIPALTVISTEDRFQGVRRAAKDAVKKIQQK